MKEQQHSEITAGEREGDCETAAYVWNELADQYSAVSGKAELDYEYSVVPSKVGVVLTSEVKIMHVLLERDRSFYIHSGNHRIGNKIR